MRPRKFCLAALCALVLGCAAAPEQAAVKPGTPAYRQAPMDLRKLVFAKDAVTLDAGMQEQLLRTVKSLLAQPSIRLEIAGYTDDRGAHDDNLRISTARAEAVRDYLVAQGIASERLTVKGYGAADPIMSNQTAEGRAGNRRVEFHLGR